MLEDEEVPVENDVFQRRDDIGANPAEEAIIAGVDRAVLGNEITEVPGIALPHRQQLCPIKGW